MVAPKTMGSKVRGKEVKTIARHFSRKRGRESQSLACAG